MAQTRKDFLLWVTFRPEEITSATAAKIILDIRAAGIEYFISFNGTMFTEDRATWHNKDLPERLSKELPLLKEKVDADYIYETNLDSDDMVHNDFSKLVQSMKFKQRGALYQKKGFAFHTNGNLADWNNPTAQQNYTIMFPSDIYFDAEKRLEYLNGFKSHEEIPEKFDAEELGEGLYCSVIHEKNISTIWTQHFRGQEYYYEEDKEKILKNFR